MNIDKDRRKLVLQELADFIHSSQCVLQNTLQTLGWDESKLNNIQFKTCPYNSEHQVPEKYLEKHLNVCKLKHEGYSSFEDFLPDPGDTAEGTIVLDEKTRSAIIHSSKLAAPDMKLMLWVVSLQLLRCGAACDSHSVPRSAARLYAGSTPDERLALYDYVIEKTKHRHSQDLPLELSFSNNGDERKDSKPKSELEVKAKERDAKRRRVSYKRVHTNRKSHTEILREVIQSQTEMLQCHIKFKK